jgi:tetratricopeptide (TPR) repeat protein
MRRLALAVLMLALPLHAADAGPVPEPRAERWVEVLSPHFLFVSSVGQAHTRDIAKQLEVVAGALATVDPRLAPTAERSTVLVFSNRRDARPWFDLVLNQRNTRAPGVYVSSGGTGTMLLDATGGWAAQRTIIHELVHDLLSRNGMRLPLWMQEGLAEYFATASLQNETVRVGAINRGHLRRLAFAKQLRLQDIVALRNASDVRESPLVYAASWAMVDWLIRRDPAAFAQLLTALDRGVASEQAIRAAYGVDLAAIERSVRAVAISDRIPTRVHGADAGEIVGRDISRDDSIVALATFLGTLDSQRHDAMAMLARVAERDPCHAGALIAMARLHARDKNFVAAEGLLERALGIAPDDPAVRIAFARVLLRDVLGVFAPLNELAGADRSRFERARILAVEGGRLGASPSDVDALVGSSWLVSSTPAEGIAPLERAVAARPARDDLIVNLYSLYLRSGRFEDANSLRDAKISHRGPQTVYAAWGILVRVRIDEANVLLARGETTEASRILRELRDETPEGGGRTYLDRQIVIVERAAANNRHIMMYNEALAAIRGNDPVKARHLLDDLIATATDEEMLRDARSLRSRL